ncbi:MAG: ABC transporter substrate-binding protein [Gammaproteobacteria bacterium]|jgi:putative ABC transport system substrate-binding protein
MLKFNLRRRVIVWLTISIMATIVIVTTGLSKLEGLPVVAIANYGPHASLQELIDGVKEQLQNEVKFKEADVNFEQTLIIQMLYKLKANKPKVMVTMGTPITQAAKNLIKDIPIVFAAVTDPVDAGLITERNKPHTNLTGVSDSQDLKIFMAFVKTLMPDAKSIGLLYATSETNDATLVKMMQTAAELYDMEVVAVPVEQSRDIPLRMQLLNGTVDLIYVGVSGTIAPSLPTIVAEADRMQIPIFSAHEEAVLNNYVVGSFGVSYRKLGNRVGDIIKLILQGEDIKNIEVVYPDLSDYQGFISKQRAAQFNINLPDNLNNVTIVE